MMLCNVAWKVLHGSGKILRQPSLETSIGDQRVRKSKKMEYLSYKKLTHPLIYKARLESADAEIFYMKGTPFSWIFDPWDSNGGS
jgi:hypothetical protein